MRGALITVAVLLTVFDAVWLINRTGADEPEYHLDLHAGEWWFADEETHIDDVSKLPVWDGKQWTLVGQNLRSIASEVGKRPLINDDRCVFEYRLPYDATLGDFLSAQRQAEDAGSSIMILTAEVDNKWFPRIENLDWFLFNSVTHTYRCGMPLRSHRSAERG